MSNSSIPAPSGRPSAVTTTFIQVMLNPAGGASDVDTNHPVAIVNTDDIRYIRYYASRKSTVIHMDDDTSLSVVGSPSQIGALMAVVSSSEPPKPPHK